METRIYSDDFNADNDQTSLWTTIRNSDTGQLMEVPAHLYPSKYSEPEVWGNDNVSIKLDSLTVIREGEVVDSTNYYEQQVRITIPNRFSAFDDSFKGDKSDAEGDVTFEVTGVLITPQDGVYYTSDKKAFIKGTAKADGIYMFYDSDQNGFYETVYILKPVPDENGAYTVMSIGFNYDGEHNFAPYTKSEFTESVPETNLEEFFRVNEVFGANWMYHFSALEDNELLFPPDLYDGYEQKDSIFEIYKIAGTIDLFPQLFYEIRHKSYDSAWAVHSENLLTDIIEQVTMMLFATGISATVQALASATVVLAPVANILGAVAYAATYALMTKFSIDVKMHKADSEERSRTFYPEGSDRRAPKSLNQRMLTDRIFKDSMPAALMGHPGAYYTTITGGTIGNEYTAQVIASPPNMLRSLDARSLVGTLGYATAGVFTGDPDTMTCLDFDDLNLDYLLLTSELNSYNDRPYYSYQTGDGYVSPTHNALYYDYRLNSLGYAQLAVDEATGGKLDSIMLKSVYNDHLGYSEPRYTFVDKDTEHNELVLPRSSLYQPLVLSKERYDALPSKPAEGQISVDVMCKYAPESEGIDPYDTSIFEKEKDYFAKIPLVDGRFLYPITSVSISVIDVDVTKGYMGQYPNIIEYDIVEESVVFTLDSLVEGTDYELKGGNLYFKKSIDDYIYGNEEAFNVAGGELNTFYRVQINFERVVAADPNGPYYNEYVKLALHQATSHVLQDFVNVHTHAQVAGSMTAEIGYTMIMTAITTALSVSLIAFGSWAAKGTEGYFGTAGLLASKAQLVGQIAKQVSKSVVAEMFEEVVIDGLIESLSENIVPMLGGTEDMAFWVSSLVTSVREAGSGIGRANMQQQAQANQDLRNWIATRQSQAGETGALSTELRKALYNRYKTIQSQAAFEQRASMSQFKKLVTSKSFKLLSLAIPSTFFGGFTLIGSIQIATAFGSKIISTPKTISQYYTGIQQGIAERRNVRRLASAAGLSPQQLKTVYTKHIGSSSTSSIPQSNPDIKSNAKDSVDKIVNDKIGETAPTSLEAMSAFGAFSAQAYYAPEFEELTTILENKKQVIEESAKELEILESSADFLEPPAPTTDDSENIVFTFKGVKEEAALMSDEVWNWEGRLMPVSAANPFSTEKHAMPTLGKTLQFARSLFRRDGLDLSRSTVGLWVDGEGNRHIIAPGVQFTAVNGKEMTMGEGDAKYTPILLDHLGYGIDISSAQTWQADTSQQIQLIYVEDLYPEEKLQLPDFYEKLTPLTSMYLTPEENEFYFETFGYYFKNNPNVLINELTVPTYRKLYGLVQDLSISMKVDIKDLNTQSPTFINDIKEKMEERWDTVFKQDIKNDFSSFTGDKKKQLVLAYEYYVEKLFEDIFEGIFEGALKDVSKRQDFIDKFEDRLQIAIMDHILREKLGIDDPYLTDFNEFNSKLNAFLNNREEVADLYSLFHESSGINKVLDVLTVSFISLPLKGNKLQNVKSKNTYFGYIQEQVFIYTRLRDIIVDTFKVILSELPAQEIEDIRSSGGHFYSSVSYYPLNPEYSNILSLEYSNIRFYQQKTTGRHFDGGGIFDFITIAISTHIKSTTLESLIESDTKTGYNLVEGLCHDGVSAMIVDVIKRVVEGRETSLDRLVRLVAPFAVSDGYAVNKFASGITLANAEYTLNKFFTTTVSQLGDKLASHEVFLASLVKMINTELYTNIKYSGLMLTEKDLKDALTDMLSSNSQFKENVIKIAKSSGLQYFKTQLESGSGFSDLSTFLTVTNFDKLKVQDSGQFKLNLILEYNPHFKTNELLRVSDFPSGVLYTLDLKFTDGMKPLTTDQELQSIAKRSGSYGLVVCHYPDHPDSIILVPSDRLNEISEKGIVVGYKHSGIIYRNIFACDNLGNKLISKLEFSASGVSIRRSIKWLVSSYQYEVAFEDGKIIGFRSNFYAAYTFITGQTSIAILQNTIVLLEHMDPYKDPLHNTVSREIRRKYPSDTPVWDLPEIILPDLNRYPDIITSQDIFNIYYNLFEFKLHIIKPSSSSRKLMYPVPFILDKLGDLNIVYDVYSGTIDLDSKRNIFDVEGIINKLFISDNELMTFLFSKGRDSDNNLIPVHKSEYRGHIATLKQWLSWMNNILTSSQLKSRLEPKGSGDRVSELIWAVIDELERLGANPLDISRKVGKINERDFSNDAEAKRGMVILSNIISLFGHNTLRNIFFHIMDFYKGIGCYKIDITTARSWQDISEYVDQFGITIPSYNPNLGISQKTGLISANTIGNHLFSLYFGEISIVFPMKDLIVSRNKVDFGFSPLSFLSSDFTYNPLYFHNNLLSYFINKFSDFKLKSYGSKGDIALVNNFYASGVEIFSVLEQEIKDYFVWSRPSSTAVDISRALMQARSEVFSWYLQIRSGSKLFPNVRHQIEDLLIGDDYCKEIELRKFGIKLFLTKDDFIGKDIKIFRYSSKGTPSTFNIDNINKNIIETRAKTLRSIINQNEGKVRLFFGVAVDDTVGFQYVKKSPSSNDKNTIYRFYPQRGLDQISYIDIDLNDPNVHNILRAIAKLSLTYFPGMNFRTPFFTMSKLGTDYNKLICAFDNRKFYSVNEIHSPMQYSYSDYYTAYEQVNIIGTEGSFDIDRANRLWNIFECYYPYSSRSNLDLIPDMNDYI